MQDAGCDQKAACEAVSFARSVGGPERVLLMHGDQSGHGDGYSRRSSVEVIELELEACLRSAIAEHLVALAGRTSRFVALSQSGLESAAARWLRMPSTGRAIVGKRVRTLALSLARNKAGSRASVSYGSGLCMCREP